MVTPRWMVLGIIAVAVHLMGPRAARAGYPQCPTDGAPLDIYVNNQTGQPQTITFTGSVIGQTCSPGSGGLATTYTQSSTCAVLNSKCATVAGLEPGLWSHQISVGSQQQGTRSVLIGYDPGGINNSVSWTAFRSVITVDNPGDSSSATCPSQPGQQTCTLRQAIAYANIQPTPALVQFNPTPFPARTPITITLTNSPPNNQYLTIGNSLMVDGTDLKGNPAFVGVGAAPTFSRLVQLPSDLVGFQFSGQGATLAGLFIRRPALTQQPPKGHPGVPVFFEGGSSQNTVVNVKIDGGASGLTGLTPGQDCIGTGNNAGTSFSNGNIVANCELEFCIDKGVKSAYESYTAVQDSWIHHCIEGGIQATFAGNVQAYHNIVERVGWNAAILTPVGTGTPTPAPVDVNANGLSSHGPAFTPTGTPAPVGPPSQLTTNGNISRNNALRGVTADNIYANASINSDFYCGNRNGIVTAAGGGGSTSTFKVRGTTSVFNWTDGVVVDDSSSLGNFGTGTGSTCAQVADPGNNAFGSNTTYDFANLNTLPTPVPAVCNQWQGCPTSSSCSPNIYNKGNGDVNYTPAETTVGAPSTLTFYPKKPRLRDIVHIVGSGFPAGTGFNAITPYQPGGDCNTDLNSCDGSGNAINGICVTVSLPNTSLTVQPMVLSVTPRDIAFVMSAVGCYQPATVTVSQNDFSGNIITPVTGTLCTNE